MVTVKRYLHHTTLQRFVDAMLHCRNALCINTVKQLTYTCTLIPSDMQSNAMVDNVRSFGDLVAN